MHTGISVYVWLAAAAIPFIYYALAIYASLRFFRASARTPEANATYAPPVSLLKPVRGLDPDAYENFASFCRQDYPEYEIVFCVDPGDPAQPLLEKLVKDFPERQIRILFGSGRTAINDKVARLVRLTNEAQHDLFIITDGDVRVRPDYLRSVVAPFRDSTVGAATCLYVSTKETSYLQQLQSIAMTSDFFAGIIMAWAIDGVKFTLSQTIVTRRQVVAAFGGYQTIEDRPADDLYVGRLAHEQGFEVVLLPYVVETVADFHSLSDLFYKRVRWMTVMRHMRPFGHLGLVFTWGLPWSLLAVALWPSAIVALAYLGSYAGFRIAMTWVIGVHGMKAPGIWKKMWLVPVWDMVAFFIWVVSFFRRSIRWRGIDYLLQGGKLVAATSGSTQIPSR